MFREAEFLTLRRRLFVDKVEIDREYIEHPSLVMDAAEHCAHAEEEVARAKAGLDVSKSCAALELRDNLVNGKQRSEAAITSELNTVHDVIDAREAHAEKERDYKLWLGLVDALKARGYTLRALTDMALAGFTSHASSPPRQRESIDEIRARRSMPKTFCSVCDEPQFSTPSGLTCRNGHGGDEGKEHPRRSTRRSVEP